MGGKKVVILSNIFAGCIVCMMTGLPRQHITPGNSLLFFQELQGVDIFCFCMNVIAICACIGFYTSVFIG